MSEYPELLILRHGQTDWNQSGRYQGQQDSDLTDLGVRQAKDQGVILAGLGQSITQMACFTSPLGRAVATASHALTAIDRTATPDPRLKEIHFGAWEGQTRAEVAALFPANPGTKHRNHWYFSAPGGEGFEAICTRVAAFLADLPGPAIIVTHGVTSMVLRGLWLGLDEVALLKLPHEQGCVYHLKDREERCLRPAQKAPVSS
jgi:broad specificity phosphatase PhoE